MASWSLEMGKGSPGDGERDSGQLRASRKALCQEVSRLSSHTRQLQAGQRPGADGPQPRVRSRERGDSQPGRVWGGSLREREQTGHEGKERRAARPPQMGGLTEARVLQPPPPHAAAQPGAGGGAPAGEAAGQTVWLCGSPGIKVVLTQ